MILTITMNPSIDISYPLPHFQIDSTNRVTGTRKTPGGKGLNVTRVLHQLGDDVMASGLLGGKLGEFLESGLDKLSISHSFYKIEGETRNCIAILHDGKQTEILEEGPMISNQEAEGFLNHFEKMLTDVNVVSISGSLPTGMSKGYYVQMVERCRKNNIPLVLDTSGESLLKVLRSELKPTVIKPNLEELSQLLDCEVSDDIPTLKAILKNDLFEKIDWVIVSLGADGAFAKHNDHFYKVNIPKILVKNPVGSGDSTVAGIASALEKNLSDYDLLKKANVLGMLNAQEETTGYVNLENFEKLYHQIEVVEV